MGRMGLIRVARNLVNRGCIFYDVDAIGLAAQGKSFTGSFTHAGVIDDSRRLPGNSGCPGKAMNRKPVLAITMGDVNGIGPEILAKALARPEIGYYCKPVIFGSVEALRAAAVFAPGMPEPQRIDSVSDPLTDGKRVGVIEAGFPGPEVRHGRMNPEAGRCAAEWIKEAVRCCLDRRVDGMVTCPISKECIQKAGYAYTGHTSLIAEMCNAADYRMCLFTETMRIVHITAHLSMRDAIAAVKADRIVSSIRIGHDALRRMGLDTPRIAVAGLNPHAGEAGVFGREEIDEILPAIQTCQVEGIPCSGPYPPDTVFRRMREGEFDMVIAMYHDQGHIPLKLIAMDEGVNVTLGIPIVRTSVDHGTAFDIAGKGLAREESLIAAVRLAAQLCTMEAVS
jgi:4-phospho-D-threonate 3-dehydrogenase / 4-phospho-D-erythronate 3-dehydrogenase